MFGRVRAVPSSSSSSLDWCLELELERPPLKIIKDDSLSIYEITLNKLRLGSKRALKSSPGEETNPSLLLLQVLMVINQSTSANNKWKTTPAILLLFSSIRNGLGFIVMGYLSIPSPINCVDINLDQFSYLRNILKNLSLAYGQMILKSGFFHADPHPGNILICNGSEVALLDYGQGKDLPDSLRLGYAKLILALADSDPIRACQSYRELGIETLTTCDNEQKEMLKLAETMFDTKLPPGVTMLQPFSEESSIKKIAVKSFPEELFSVLRTVHLLSGLSVGMGINYSCAELWRPIAEEALYSAGRL